MLSDLRFEAWLETKSDEDERRQWYIKGQIVHYILFPTFGMILVQIIAATLSAQGWRHELFNELVGVFWAVLIYRLLIRSLYLMLDVETMRRYHYRFLGPLFFLIGRRLAVKLSG